MARVDDMGMEAVETQLSTAVSVDRQGPDFRLTRLIATVREEEGRPTIIAEVRRGHGTSTPGDLAKSAAAAMDAGADTVAICSDAEATPQGLVDLFTVCRAIKQPVVARDWYLHPIQLVDAKEAGAAAVLGITMSVTGRGSSILSQYASALGMEAPVEIVNKQQSDEAEKLGIPFVSVNVGIQLTLGMASIAAQIAAALVQDQPFGNLSMVGVKSMADVTKAAAAGASCIFVADSFFEANAQQLAKHVPADATFDEMRQACLEEVLAVLSQD